jgi:hypothetical protein
MIHSFYPPNHITNEKVGAVPTLHTKVTLRTVSSVRAQRQAEPSRPPVNAQDARRNLLTFLNDITWV